MKLDFLRKLSIVAAMTAYLVFYGHSYHAGEFWRLKDLTWKKTKTPRYVRMTYPDVLAAILGQTN